MNTRTLDDGLIVPEIDLDSMGMSRFSGMDAPGAAVGDCYDAHMTASPDRERKAAA